MSDGSYLALLSSLIRYGSTFDLPDWPDYKTDLGLTAAHVPDLARIVADPALYLAADDSPEAWAPTHAWRALAQLNAIEVIAPMLQLIETDSSTLAYFEFPRVMSQVGPRAIDLLAGVVTNANRPEAVRAAAIDGLPAIGKSHPESRPECVEPLVRQLIAPRLNSIELNATIVKALCDLGAREALPLIKTAFLEQQVDLSEITWDDVHAALGL